MLFSKSYIFNIYFFQKHFKKFDKSIQLTKLLCHNLTGHKFQNKMKYTNLIALFYYYSFFKF